MDITCLKTGIRLRSNCDRTLCRLDEYIPVMLKVATADSINEWSLQGEIMSSTHSKARCLWMSKQHLVLIIMVAIYLHTK